MTINQGIKQALTVSHKTQNLMDIILFTQVYPDEAGKKTLRSSAVCHYWTREWVQAGHNVVVVYCYPNYCRLFHWIAKLFPQFISQFTNGTLTRFVDNVTDYEKDGVKILKIPIRKFMPKIKYPHRIVEHVVDQTMKYIRTQGFKPDLILSHFDNPILEIAGMFKDQIKVPFSFVLHGYAKDIRRLYPQSYRQLIEKVDVWGFRSPAIRRDFESNYGKLNRYFICYSGIPRTYIGNLSAETIKQKGKIVYVGALMQRKYPARILEGLLPMLKSGVFSLTYIGEGALDKKIRRLAKKHGIEDRVRLLGQISREQVQEELATAEYFVMISRHETFGLVYLEAMAHGCLTIASKNEGFDGILEHGKNGFLCEAGNANELRALFEKINAMDVDSRNRVANKAIETAKSMTDDLMAEKYLNDVLDLLGLDNSPKMKK